MIRRALVGALVLFSVVAGIALADAPVSLDEYRAIVHAAFTLVDRAVSEASPDARAPLFTQAGNQLARVLDVEIAPGENVRIQYAELVNGLKAAGAGNPSVDIDDLHERLAALDIFLAALPTEPSPSDRARLREIFNRPPFVTESENSLAQLQRQLLDWLGRLLSNTAHGVFDLRDVIVLVGVAIVTVASVVLVFTLWRHLVAAAQVKQKETAQAPLTATGALAQARRFANAGDLREAVRELYLATLLMLDERGLLRYDRSLTNREYLDIVAGEPTVRAALEPIVSTFDRTWYGFQAIGQEDYENYRRQVEGMRNL